MRADEGNPLGYARLLRSVLAGERLLPATVITETAYLQQARGAAKAAARLLEDPATGAWPNEAAPAPPRHYRRLRQSRWRPSDAGNPYSSHA